MGEHFKNLEENLMLLRLGVPKARNGEHLGICFFSEGTACLITSAQFESAVEILTFLKKICLYISG